MTRNKTHSIIGAIAGGPVMGLLAWSSTLEASAWKACLLGWLFSVPVAVLDYYLGDGNIWRRSAVSVPAGAILGVVVWILFEPGFIPVWALASGFALLAVTLREVEHFMERLVRK